METIMKSINISHKKTYKASLYESSSEADKINSTDNILKEDGFWRTEKRTYIKSDYFIIDFEKNTPVNQIEISTSPNGKTTFPESFRIEGSYNAKNWYIVHNERSLNLGDTTIYTINMPIINLRFLKFFITKHNSIESEYYSEIGRFHAGISGIKNISASESSIEHSTEKILDNRSDTYWESKMHSKSAKEIMDIDLGGVFHINRISLNPTSLSPHGFPEDLSVEISTDKSTWTSIFEERDFISESSTKYSWKIDTIPARFIQFTMQGVMLEKNNYGVRFSELEIYSGSNNIQHFHNIGEISPYASIFQPGLIKLAKDGGNLPATAVQGNDSRLRDASSLFKGIVQLADDGADTKDLAVQASDSRLKDATELKNGIVRLAKNGEANPGLAIQGNDSRLKEASEENYGIVKFCPNGEYSELGAVKGNDTRLQKADTTSPGICRLADNGEKSPDCAVQGNDNRLRDATTTYKGIIELAEDGEDREGVAVQGNDKRLRVAATAYCGIVELAENGEDKEGVVVQGNDKRLREATTDYKGIVQLGKDGEDKKGVAVQGNDKRLKDATISTKGIIKFAKDGETIPLTAVQADDSRLKDATTHAKGIVELAENGENKEGVVVQGNDDRLRDATTTNKGIIELAEDGEEKEGVAVQGNDRRLKNATTEAKGIVELAENGEDKAGVVVQGNDKRLKNASTNSKGILRFAKNGEEAPAAVQGNDKRLREATTTYKGIVELAEDGEDKEGVAVQGNDKRLKNATVTTKGIVELAENGEDKNGVVVQGNDKRLKPATEKSPGIIQMARNGDNRKGFAVQADDSRLSDARTALPHSHDYSPLNHDYNSHTGTIKIIDNKNEKLGGLVPPSDESAVIYAKNESKHSGAIGIAGISNPLDEKSKNSYGIVGHSRFVGIRGQSTGNNDNGTRGSGLLGLSKFGAGGVFASEHSYSLVADGYGQIKKWDDSLNLQGNGDALYVNGKSNFNGRIYINSDSNENNAPLNMVEMFEVNEDEIILPGDLLIVSKKGDSILSRSRDQYTKSVIGVISHNPIMIINNSNTEKKIYPVILAGKALCRVDAREKTVNPGDLIVTSNTPGCGMAGEIDSFDKIGTVVGKALDSLADNIGIIPIFISHS